MKKLTALMITLVLVMLWCAPALALQQYLMDQDGIVLYMMELEINSIGDFPQIRMKIRGRNETDVKVFVDMKNAKVDGVPVLTAGRSIEAHTEIPENDPLLFSFRADDKDGGISAEAIRTGRILEFDIQVSNHDTYKTLTTGHASVQMARTETGNREIQSAKTAPAYTPASTDYTGIKRGSSGQAVKDLQQRLKDLGYYTGKVDGTYGESTIVAVRAFCLQNYVTMSNDVTPEIQKRLYSNRAEYFLEPYVPLVIGPFAKWDKPVTADSDVGFFYTQLVNLSKDRTIRGYELYYYFTNVWGEKIAGEKGNEIYFLEHTEKIEPGEVTYDFGFPVKPFAYTYAVHYGVHKVVFYDGEIREIPEAEIRYYSCPINEG